MKPTELRLGNLFIEKHSQEIIEVIELKKDAIVFTGSFKDAWQAVPIPLTYEWMKKLGFDTMDYEVDVIEWGMSDDPYFSIEQAGVPPEDKPYMFTYDVGMGETEIEVKYVHELQNLYFAIKRKELKCTS